MASERQPMATEILPPLIFRHQPFSKLKFSEVTLALCMVMLQLVVLLISTPDRGAMAIRKHMPAYQPELTPPKICWLAMVEELTIQNLILIFLSLTAKDFQLLTLRNSSYQIRIMVNITANL